MNINGTEKNKPPNVRKACRYCVDGLVPPRLWAVGLCSLCWGKRKVRYLKAKDRYGGAMPVDPLGPTKALPGSTAKVEVMRDRVERGYSPFHPDDVKCSGCQY